VSPDPDRDPPGTLITVGASAAEPGRGASGGDQEAVATARCLNCSTALLGRYCHGCGQPAQLHRSLHALLEEVLQNVLHFEARGWRTLPLLVLRPGLLTRRYIDGQRRRYLSPLALFLFCSFLMFFVISLVSGPNSAVTMDPAQRASARAQLAQELAQDKDRVARASAALETARRAGADTGAAREALSDARLDQRVAQAALGAIDAVGAGPASLLPHTGYPRLDALLQRALRDPELFLYRLENTTSKLLFMLIPISLPFLSLLFAGRRSVTLYDHAVFSIYSLSFMALLIVACALLGRVGAGGLAMLLLLGVPPVHMFTQLRGAYGLESGAALWRTVALLAVAGTAFALFLLLVIAISLR
jgi:hypothetical protein